jgi:hypothetical protein
MLFAILDFGSNPAPCSYRPIFHLHTEEKKKTKREGRQIAILVVYCKKPNKQKVCTGYI